jgi:hypothetical protein
VNRALVLSYYACHMEHGNNPLHMLGECNNAQLNLGLALEWGYTCVRLKPVFNLLGNNDNIDWHSSPQIKQECQTNRVIMS